MNRCASPEYPAWLAEAASRSPLMACVDSESWGGEDGVLKALFAELLRQDGFAVEFGQRSLGGSTVSKLVQEHGWSALFMDVAAPEQTQQVLVEGGGTVTLARERITPSNISALLHKHKVPPRPDCMVIDVDGLDFWIWDSIDPYFQPGLVVIEYNVHVGLHIEATIEPDENWVYQSTKDYGASFSALCGLAARKGYRLIHIHGPWNLYFLRTDLDWPAERSVYPDLDEAGFKLLTDTNAFYDTLCGGKRPSWFASSSPDVSRAPWQILCPPQRTQTLDIAGVSLQVLGDKHDLQWYQQRKSHEEIHSQLYLILAAENFKSFIDIGANIGMNSIIARRAVPGIRLVCVEADPQLVDLMKANFAHHAINDAVIVNAAAGSVDCSSVTFSLNPTSTLDNRVNVAGWPKVNVPAVRMDRLLTDLQLPPRAFIKIDTQGFELHVLHGLVDFLEQRNDWLLKMEFAPDWLESQDTDPQEVLEFLQQRFEFAEFLERVPYGLSSTDSLFAYPIASTDHSDFLRHVRAQNKNGLGWVDLIVRPRKSATGLTPVYSSRLHDRFSELPPDELHRLVPREKWFHDMHLAGNRTGSWVYGAEMPPNYHLFPILRYLNELDVTGACCLDIGTYDGMTAFSLAARGAGHVDATCQFDLDRFRIARALGGWSRLAYFPATDLDTINASFLPAQYDLIVMSAMLHHLLSPLEALVEARRLVKAGGFLLVEVVVRDGLPSGVQLNTALDDPVYGQPTIWIPSELAFTEMLRFAGFTVRSQTQLIGTRRARETNYDRVTWLAQAVSSSEIDGAKPALTALHKNVKQIGKHALVPEPSSNTDPVTIQYRGSLGRRTLNPWLEQPVDLLQPDWKDPDPIRHAFIRVADNTDFARLVSKHANGAFTPEDLRHLPSRYPGQQMPEGMHWGLKQLGNLHVLDHVFDLGLRNILEIGPGFNLYFPNHLPSWCEYTGLDDSGFYPDSLISDAESTRIPGRRVRGLLGKGNHCLPLGTFDACVSVSVLEHVADADINSVSSEMYALLRPGGWALHSIDVPVQQIAVYARRWFSAMEAVGFLVKPEEVSLDVNATPFTEPLSIQTTFYGAYRPSIWDGNEIRLGTAMTTLLVAMRKPRSTV